MKPKKKEVVWIEKGSHYYSLIRIVEHTFADGRTDLILEGTSSDDAMGNPVWDRIDAEHVLLRAAIDK